jgi:hypothetical protein
MLYIKEKKEKKMSLFGLDLFQVASEPGVVCDDVITLDKGEYLHDGGDEGHLNVVGGPVGIYPICAQYKEVKQIPIGGSGRPDPLGFGLLPPLEMA